MTLFSWQLIIVYMIIDKEQKNRKAQRKHVYLQHQMAFCLCVHLSKDIPVTVIDPSLSAFSTTCPRYFVHSEFQSKR